MRTVRKSRRATACGAGTLSALAAIPQSCTPAALLRNRLLEIREHRKPTAD